MKKGVVILTLLLSGCAGAQTTSRFAGDVAERSCAHLKAHESYGACYKVAYDWAASYKLNPRARRHASADAFLAAVNKVYGKEMKMTCEPIGDGLYFCKLS